MSEAVLFCRRHSNSLDYRMTYSLTKLAAGSYDLWLDGKIIGSVVKGGSDDAPIWIAELLVDLPPEQRLAPFTKTEHEFMSLGEVRAWLGLSEGPES
jgi:hypothetical protein